MGLFKRKIFYLAGFDPRGAGFYHRLYGEQIAAHNAAGGEALVLGARAAGAQGAMWPVTGANLAAEHQFLGWDDIVRRRWIRGAPALMRATLGAYARLLRDWDWASAAALPRGSRIALAYPGVSLMGVPVGIAALAGLVAGGVLAPPVLRRLHSLWLARLIVFNDALARGEGGAELDARLDAYADTIDSALAQAGWDEVLLVTHSNGSILAMPLLARLLARRGGAMPDHFALVTLGQCIPLVSLRRGCRQGAALDRVAAGRFAWLDIGSLTDGACAPLVPPLLGRAVAAPQGLVQLSPRWFRYCDPAGYTRRRRDKYRTHFDYLRRLDRASPLDYLGITCAARPLAASIAAFRAENAA